MFKVKRSFKSKLKSSLPCIILMGLLCLELKTYCDLYGIKDEACLTLERDGTYSVKLYNEEYYPIYREQYSELYSTYDEYVKKIAQVIKDKNYPGELITQYSFYLAMLKNGYLSVGDEFNYGYNDLEIKDELGFNIATGKGVCRNQAANLTAVLCELGYDARTISGCLYTEDGLDEYSTNHAITYVRHKGYDYFLDPTNEDILLKKAPNALCSVYSTADKYCIMEIDLDEINAGNPDKEPIDLEEHDDYLADGERIKEKFELGNGIANLYNKYFETYEAENLLEYEEKIVQYLSEINQEYNKKMGLAKPCFILNLKLK